MAINPITDYNPIQHPCGMTVSNSMTLVTDPPPRVPLRMTGSLSVYKNRAPRLRTTNHGRAMDSICMVIDLEGFQLSKDSGATFLVRDFGWCEWDRTMTGNTHFDHGWCWRDLSKKDQRTVSYAIDGVHRLSFKPGAHEHSLPVSTLPDLVMELPSKFSTPERLVVAYKGGIQEKLLLHKLGLPCLDLEDVGWYGDVCV